MESALREGGRDPALRLIETVLWDGAKAPRWPLHLDRLQRSAHALGWVLPPLPAMPAPRTPARLRLLASPHLVEWQEFPLPPALDRPWKLSLSDIRLDAADPWLSVKSTRREIHDRARAALPEGADEVIFLNTQGALAEGTITNIFFDRGQGLRTPPLSSGALPGVLRAELNLPEEVLRAEDLPHVKLWVGNALRGLMAARLL